MIEGLVVVSSIRCPLNNSSMQGRRTTKLNCLLQPHWWLLSLLLFLLSACSQDESEKSLSSEQTSSPENSVSLPIPTLNKKIPEKVETLYKGDLDALHRRGQLRILVPANLGGGRYLTRKGSPVGAQQEAAEAFAESQGLTAKLVPVERFSDMLPALIEGRGDIIAANLTVTPKRKQKVSFSVPITHVREQVLVRADDDRFNKVADLKSLRFMADKNSSFWSTLEKLHQKAPSIEVLERPPGVQDEDELDLVAQGDIDASVRDSNIANMYLAYRDDLKVALNLGKRRAIAWAVRKGSPQLRAALNEFLHLQHLSGGNSSLHKGDLSEIKERKVLRVLLRNNAASYFLYKGELMGFEYELAKAFAKKHKLRIEVVVPPSSAELIQWLEEGYGDMAVGFLEPLEAVKERGIAFSRPYHYAPRFLISHKDSPLKTKADLNGKTVVVRKSSAYWGALKKLQQSGVDIILKAAAEDSETEELIEQVAKREIELTVADGHLLDIELAQGREVRSVFVLGENLPHAVALRAKNTQLKKAVDSFIKKQYKGLVYNVLYKKYFKNTRKIRALAEGRIDHKSEQLSPYDKLVKKFADQYGFDWRLVIAQMYQESRFNPKARSFAGARGLLQVMPRTAKSMGLDKLENPETGIHAGVKYLDWVRDRFEPELNFSDRIWFTLAAYNAGHGHVQDARRLAKRKGWDSNRWFNNTEKAMLLLAKKQYAKSARYGYVRGTEPVNYVRGIRQRFQAYVQSTQQLSGSINNSLIAKGDL